MDEKKKVRRKQIRDAHPHAPRTPAKLVTFEGRTHTILEWSREFGIQKDVLSARIRNGWDVEKALKTPVRGGPDRDGLLSRYADK